MLASCNSEADPPQRRVEASVTESSPTATAMDRSHSSHDAKRVRLTESVVPSPKSVDGAGKRVLAPVSFNIDTPASKSSCYSTSCSHNHDDCKPMTPEQVADLLWEEARYRKPEPTPQDSITASNNNMNCKRTDYLSWDDYFMAVAALSAKRSKDPHHPSGCCLVDKDNRILGIGYNGFPMGCHDDCLPWQSSSSTPVRAENTDDTSRSSKAPVPWLHSKEAFCVHAKVNAILNKSSTHLVGARLYAKTFPCHECTKVIVQSRISEVVYSQEPDREDESIRASRIMLTMGGVKMRRYVPIRSKLELSFPNVVSPSSTPSNSEAETAGEQESNDTSEDSNSPSKAIEDGKSSIQEQRDLMLQEASYDPLESPSGKRLDVLTWDDYFMSMAVLTAMRSKDPNTQVGACIVKDKRIVAAGYNGFPAGCSDDALPWARQADNELHKKYPYVCHAEANTILNKNSADVRGGTLYVDLFPCNECAKLIVQSGIAQVVYMKDQYHDTDACRASRILLRSAGVRLRQHVPKDSRLVIDSS